MKQSRLSETLLFLCILFILVSCNKNVKSTENISQVITPATTHTESVVITSSSPEPLPTQPQTDFSSDALLAVTEIENTHPSFLLGDLTDNYNDVRDEYLTHTSEPMTITEFILATQKYLTVLSDGHMGGGLLQNGLYLDVKWIAVNSAIYLVNENGTISDTQVILVGGVPVKEVLRQVDIYYYAENDAAQQRQYSVFSRQEEMLFLAGCHYKDNSLTLTLQNGSETSTVECKFVNRTRYSEYCGKSPTYIIRHRMINDVFYIDLRAFEDDSSVDNTASAIIEAIENGTSKFIIDIRDNSGGNSIVGNKLLEAMGMNLPKYGCYIRYSEMSERQRGGSNGEEYVYFEPTTKSAQNNKNISLVVLTNTITFSSATMLGVWVQDGGLGTIIGQPSSNSPTSYGDMLNLRLPTSRVDLQISYKKFLRPDSKADPTTLHPDILVDIGEDALEIALDYLSQR